MIVSKPKTLSISEVVERTGFSRDSVYELIEKGFLLKRMHNPSRTRGRGWWRVDADELEKFLEVSRSIDPQTGRIYTPSRQLAAMKQYRSQPKRSR